MEYVDILLPPTFEKSGKTKTLEEAWAAQDWIGTFNLWIIQKSPIPSVVYQLRSPRSSWAPGKLDVAAGGHYSAGETILDGMREVREELGKEYPEDSLIHLGRRINVSLDTRGRTRNNVVDICCVFDDAPLSSYILEEKEVYAISACPIESLGALHTGIVDRFMTEAITVGGEKMNIEVTRDSFPYNWDRYHQKMVKIIPRLLTGEKDICY